MLETSH